MAATQPLAETLTTALVGWRGYQLCRPHYLTSHLTVVEPRKRAEATCNDKDHFAPTFDCSCGFHAFETFEQLESNGYYHQDFLAEVWLWGHVVKHSKGYRAQYLYPKTLYSDNPMAGYVGWLYGCEVASKPQVAKANDVEEPPMVKPVYLTLENLLFAAFNEEFDTKLRLTAATMVRQRLASRKHSAMRTLRRLEIELKEAEEKRGVVEGRLEAVTKLLAKLRGRQ